MSERGETGETAQSDTAALLLPPLPVVDDVLHALHALGIAVPDETEVREYLRRNADVLPVVRAASERLRAHFGPRTSLSLELYRDPEFPTRTLTLYVRQRGDQRTLLREVRAFTDTIDDELSAAETYLHITTDFLPPQSL